GSSFGTDTEAEQRGHFIAFPVNSSRMRSFDLQPGQMIMIGMTGTCPAWSCGNGRTAGSWVQRNRSEATSMVSQREGGNKKFPDAANALPSACNLHFGHYQPLFFAIAFTSAFGIQISSWIRLGLTVRAKDVSDWSPLAGPGRVSSPPAFD